MLLDAIENASADPKTIKNSLFGGKIGLKMILKT